MTDGPWRNPCPLCGTKQPPCPPTCGFHPDDEDLELPVPHPEHTDKETHA